MFQLNRSVVLCFIHSSKGVNECESIKVRPFSELNQRTLNEETKKLKGRNRDKIGDMWDELSFVTSTVKGGECLDKKSIEHEVNFNFLTRV